MLHIFTSILLCKHVEGVKTDSLPAVFKDFQLPSIQFCPIELGDGILHVTSRGKLDHAVGTFPLMRT